MKFSIIIPVYNVESFLKKCLDSVVNQTYKKFEAIIVCDKCSDNSEKIVDEYVKNNKNFKKIYAENTGLAEAKNIGLEKVKGDYILFLDGDDYIELNLLETLNNELQDNLDMIRFQVQDVEGEKLTVHNEKEFDITTGIEAFNKIIAYHYVENSWCYAYKNSFWKENDFKFMKNCIAEDYGLTPLIIAKAKSVKSISYIGYNYVQRENSLMSNKDYFQKIKKMEDMLLQAMFLKGKLEKIDNNERFISFINNSLIYYSTTLSKKDYKKYNKILKEQKCFNHLKPSNIKQRIKFFIIKNYSWFFYHNLVR